MAGPAPAKYSSALPVEARTEVNAGSSALDPGVERSKSNLKFNLAAMASVIAPHTSAMQASKAGAGTATTTLRGIAVDANVPHAVLEWEVVIVRGQLV